MIYLLVSSTVNSVPHAVLVTYYSGRADSDWGILVGNVFFTCVSALDDPFLVMEAIRSVLFSHDITLDFIHVTARVVNTIGRGNIWKIYRPHIPTWNWTPVLRKLRDNGHDWPTIPGARMSRRNWMNDFTRFTPLQLLANLIHHESSDSRPFEIQYMDYLGAEDFVKRQKISGEWHTKP